jgi:hypothetical protein
MIPRFLSPEGEAPREPVAPRLSSYRPAMRKSRGPHRAWAVVRQRTSRWRAVPRRLLTRRRGCEAWFRIHSPTLPRRIDRFQRSCRARPPRASPAKRHDELGHPAPHLERWSRCPGRGFRIRVGADTAVTPVTFRPTSATHDFVSKERAPPLSRYTPHRIPRDVGALGFTPRGSLRRAGMPTRDVSFPRATTGVPLTLRRRTPRPPHDVRRCSEHGPPTEHDVRRCRPAGHAK